MAHVCFFTRTLPAHGPGGNEWQAQLTIDALDRARHRVTVITSRHPRGVEREEAKGVEVRYLGEAPSLLSPDYWEASTRAFEAIHTRDPIDLVMDISMAGYGWATLCRQRWPLPFVPFFTGGWKDTLRNRWADNEGLADLVHFFLKALPEWWWGYRRWYREVIEAASLILAGNPSLVSIISKEFGAPEAKFRAAFAPADVELFFPDPALRSQVRKQYSFGEEQPVILMVATLSKQKGLHVGLEAVGRLSDAFPHLGVLIVGGGPFEASLRGLVERLSITERVVFCGPVERETLPSYYNASDIFINPTLRIEGMQFVLTEAMACATPIIASAIGGVSDIIVHNHTGRLVPPGDVSRLSDEIAHLLAHPEESRALAENSLQYVHERLTRDHYQKFIENIVKEVLSEQN